VTVTGEPVLARAWDETAPKAQRDATEEPVGPDQVDCAVIVVTYNNAEDICVLLASLPAATEGLSVRTVVVDNRSSDRTVQLVRDAGGATCVETGANLGYAGAINVGRAHVGRCSSILVLNADLVLEPGAVSALFARLSQPRVGVAVPRLLDEHGTLFPSLRREPTVLGALGDALCGAHFPRRPGWASEMVWKAADYDRTHPVDWATGAVMLIAADCDAAVGSWDEGRFFLYSEETDFAARTRAAGWSVDYVPAARARHRQGSSGQGPDLAALMAVNRIRYYEKHHGRARGVVFRWIAVLHELLRCADPVHRRSLFFVLRRSSWVRLPGGRVA
jgi:GT2 family glycosyltransferase